MGEVAEQAFGLFHSIPLGAGAGELGDATREPGGIGGDDEDLVLHGVGGTQSQELGLGDIAHVDTTGEQSGVARGVAPGGADAAGAQDDGADTMLGAGIGAHLLAEDLGQAIELLGLALQLLIYGQICRGRFVVPGRPDGGSEHDPLDPRLDGGFQNVLGADDVDFEPRIVARLVPGGPVQGSDVDDRIHALARHRHILGAAQIPFDKRKPVAGVAHFEMSDMKLLPDHWHERSADKPASASH